MSKARSVALVLTLVAGASLYACSSDTSTSNGSNTDAGRSGSSGTSGESGTSGSSGSAGSSGTSGATDSGNDMGTGNIDSGKDAGSSGSSGSSGTTDARPSSQTHCEANPSQCGYPDATNTGVPAGTSLTIVNGDMTISSTGAVVEDKDIRGCVTVTAPGVTIRRSKITCDGIGTIRTTDAAAAPGAARLLIEDVELVNGGNTTAMGSDNMTARRVYSHGGENGADFSSDVTIEDSFITGIVEVNGGHGDGIQISAPAANILINHNTIFGHHVTSAVNWTDPTVGMTVQNNLLAGGSYALYCPRVAVPDGAFQTLDNRFGTYTFGHTNSCGNTGQVFTGNYSDVDLSPILPE